MASQTDTPLVGGIEAGGTKFVCVVGHGPGAGLLARERFSTGDRPAVVVRAVRRDVSGSSGSAPDR